MGLGIAIAGSISIAVVFMVITVIPGTSDKLVDVIDARSQINSIDKKLDKTLLQISSLTAESGTDIFAFDLKNVGFEKIWDYHMFDFIITYDADISGTKTKLNEKFTFNEPASFQNTPIQYARPFQDISVGGWTSTPLYDKINETKRNDVTFITSPSSTTSPTNDVEVKLSPLTDPNTGYGHILRYTYKSELVTDSKGMLGYGEKSATAARYRPWTGSSFSSEASVNQLPLPLLNDIQWMVVKSSPNTVEKVMGFVVSSTNTLYIKTWDGASWTSNWSTLIGGSDTRRFDIAYESSSGDVVVAFGDGTNNLKFRKRVAGTWDATNQDSGINMGSTTAWIVAKSKPTNDDIFVGVITQSTTLQSMRWNGSTNSWGNQVTTTTAPFKRDYQCFDIAFERNSGNAFLIWADASKNLLYKKFTTSWGSDLTAYSGLADKIRWVVADGDRNDPTSNKIAVGMSSDSNDLEFGVWNGASWVTKPSALAAADKNQRGISVQFDRNGMAMFVFPLSASKPQMSWRTWTSTGGFSSVTTETGSSDDIRFIQLKADPLSNKMMVLYYDKSSDLFYRLWNGSSWSALGAALETDLSVSTDKEPFMYAWDNVPLTTLTVQLLDGSTVVAQWNEGNIYGLTSWIQKERKLTASEANSITDYTNLRVKYKVDGNQIRWSWAELQITSFSGNANEWGINNIGSDVLDPKILNPGETAAILGKLPYPPYLGGAFKVSVITDTGKVVSSSITVS